MKKIALFSLCSALIAPALMAETSQPEQTTIMGPAHLSGEDKGSLKVMGPAKLKKMNVESLDIMGPLDFEDLKVKGNSKIMGPVEGKDGQFASFHVTGPLKAEKLTCDSFTAIGPTTLEKSQIKSDTDIIGPFFAEDSSFQKIMITMDKAELKDSTSKAIYVRKNNPEKVQKLKLKGKTVIDGPIEFESGKGIVKADKDVVIKGEIKGAELKRK